MTCSHRGEPRSRTAPATPGFGRKRTISELEPLQPHDLSATDSAAAAVAEQIAAASSGTGSQLAASGIPLEGSGAGACIKARPEQMMMAPMEAEEKVQTVLEHEFGV